MSSAPSLSEACARPTAISSATAASILLVALLGREQVAAPILLADHIADAPPEHRVPVVPQPAGAHGRVKLHDRGAEVLRRGAEIHHVHALGAESLRKVRGLPWIGSDALHIEARAQVAQVVLDARRNRFRPRG